MKPTARTLKLLREWGLNYDKTETWIPFAPGDPRRRFSPGMKKDYLGIIDYIAFNEIFTIGVQSCGADFAAHIRTICIDERLNTLDWLASPHRKLWLIGWRKVKKNVVVN